MIGIMSDSHDNLNMVREAVRLFNDSCCGLVLHAGDFVAPFAAQELSGLHCPVKAVYGNCDGEKQGLKREISGIGQINDAPFFFKYEGLNFLLMHVPYEIKRAARSGKYHFILYGHTHRPEIFKESGVICINPGETGGWVTGKSTAVLLDEKTMDAEIVCLG
ncbi:MAG: metallophosphoesterase [Candidatus Aminicenantes bacterium]|nr:metallophosphoesterase [Candidatus Aminicenantes bacterium]